MADQKTRVWVERLMRGDIRDGDLKGLFLYARDRFDGRDVVKEIGDFSAHYTERDKGIVTKAARDWYAIVTFHSAHNFAGNPPIQNNRMPIITPYYFDAMITRVDYSDLYKNTGVKSRDARVIAAGLRSRLHPNSDGTYAFVATSEADAKVLSYICGLLKVQHLFDGSKLTADVLHILKSAGVISKEEIRTHPELNYLFQIYAIAIMHNCRVKIDGIDPIRLHAVRGPDGLQMDAASPHATMERVVISAPIFVTRLQPDECCEADMLADVEWTRDIEVTPAGKLGYLN